jgi:hypothetical protein
VPSVSPAVASILKFAGAVKVALLGGLVILTVGGLLYGPAPSVRHGERLIDQH